MSLEKKYSVQIDGEDYSSDSDTSSSGEEGAPPQIAQPEIIEVSKRKYVRKKPIDPEAVAQKLVKARANRKPPKEKKQPKQKLEQEIEPKIINNYYYNNGKEKEQPPEPQTPRQIPKQVPKPAASSPAATPLARMQPAVKPKPIMSFV